MRAIRMISTEIYEPRGTEAYLEEMERKGYHLDAAGKLLFYFKRTEPQDMRYRVEYWQDELPDELIAQYNIPNGNFDTITGCKYSIPSFLDIGKLYSIMIEDCARPGEEAAELIRIFSSFISDEISNFKTGLYYETPSYLECSYREGRLLD